MPVATNNGLIHSALKIPANKHSIHTGKFAPATLITGLHPARKNAHIQPIDKVILLAELNVEARLTPTVRRPRGPGPRMK